jgi:dGTPase
MDTTAKRVGRRYEDRANAKDQRKPFEHDRDRVLYASSFRRLAGVTQVAAADERHLLHNRLTHSLTVAQLARRMAEYVTRSHPDLRVTVSPSVAETAGLIHDIGHPPFGHAAEDVLDELMHGYGGFEGNAQSFRVVTRLAVRKDRQKGLNLTRATLDGTLKYPCCQGCKTDPTFWPDRSYGKKWGVYADDFEDYQWVRPGDSACHIDQPAQRSVPRASEAILVDWADDVSYATHDIEDYYRAGLIPLHDLKNHWAQVCAQVIPGLEKRLGTSFVRDAFNAAAERLIRRTCKWAPYADSDADRAQIRTETSQLIERYVGAISTTGASPYLSIDDDAQYEVEVLKSLTQYFVIETPGLSIAQRGQACVVSALFNQLLEMSGNPKTHTPQALRELLGDRSDQRERAVCDYLASLTEAQAVDLHCRLTSADSARSIFGTWF